jgi:CRP-like cAMP-binding protein
MDKITVDDIKTINVFKNISSDTTDKLMCIARKIKLKKGDALFVEKQKVDTIYAVLKGKMTMFRYTEEGQKRVVYILNPGEILNEVIFDFKPASISSEAFEESEIISFNRNEFLKIMQSDFDLTKGIVDSMARKIRRLYRQIKNTVPIRMDKRVAAKLWMLSRDYGVETKNGVKIDLNITVTYLADMLGSSRETISRAMKQLETLELVSYEDKRIVIKSREDISRYFKGV